MRGDSLDSGRLCPIGLQILDKSALWPRPQGGLVAICGGCYTRNFSIMPILSGVCWGSW